MKKLLTLSTLLFLTSNFLFAQNKDSLINDIRGKYKVIEENIASYHTDMNKIWGESTDGGQATAFYDKSNLRKIEVAWFGESGKRIIEYYLDKGELFFAFDQHFKYNRPYHWDKKLAEENNDNEVFDLNKTTVKENRYYFHDEKLFLWLDNDKKEIDLTLETNKIVGKKRIAHCYKIKDEFRK